MSALRHLLILLAIVLTGAGLRFSALGQDRRFHPDEALFSTFAREAALGGHWNLAGDLDKPPLAIYASAIAMALTAARQNEAGVLDFSVRHGEFAARLPGTLIGVLLILTLYRLAASLYANRDFALVAALFAALSPLAIAFSATAFTDALMLPLMTLSLWMAVERRWRWSGLWLGLAFASKQQALVYLPLALALGWALGGLRLEHLKRFFAAFGAVALLLILWDALRPGPSFWALGAANNTPDRFIRSDELGPRLIRWGSFMPSLLGAPTALFMLVIPLALANRIHRHISQRETIVDLVLTSLCLIYALAHWLIAFNTYDRYLLPLLPPFILLSARAGAALWQWLAGRISTGERTLAAGVVVIAMIVSAFEASAFRLGYPQENSSFADYRGIDALAATLNETALGAIIYDHWLNWQLGYYMGQWSNKRRVYYPDPAALARDAAADADPAPRYFPAPAAEPLDRWLEALAAAGFESERIYLQDGWTIQRLRRP
ncbi:MAG: glycosyltransferase family 39 protein [Aggregatilineales bacterium]